MIAEESRIIRLENIEDTDRSWRIYRMVKFLEKLSHHKSNGELLRLMEVVPKIKHIGNYKNTNIFTIYLEEITFIITPSAIVAFYK